ncbi:hypothetical protein L208DRAFT_1402677 [Tricholoma matsutake]|nr:hypothetical protein L208DRAFT_1402677 [Tricholoma matsutake 945]
MGVDEGVVVVEAFGRKPHKSFQTLTKVQHEPNTSQICGGIFLFNFHLTPTTTNDGNPTTHQQSAYDNDTQPQSMCATTMPKTADTHEAGDGGAALRVLVYKTST